MGRSCSTRGGEEKFIYGFGWNDWRKVTTRKRCVWMSMCGLDRTYNSSVKGQLTTFCGYGDEHSHSLKYPEFSSSWGRISLSRTLIYGVSCENQMRLYMSDTHAIRTGIAKDAKCRSNSLRTIQFLIISYARIRYRDFHAQQKVKI